VDDQIIISTKRLEKDKHCDKNCRYYGREAIISGVDDHHHTYAATVHDGDKPVEDIPLKPHEFMLVGLPGDTVIVNVSDVPIRVGEIVNLKDGPGLETEYELRMYDGSVQHWKRPYFNIGFRFNVSLNRELADPVIVMSREYDDKFYGLEGRLTQKSEGNKGEAIYIVEVPTNPTNSLTLSMLEKFKNNKSENTHLSKMAILYQNKFAKRVLEAIYSKI